MLEPGALGDQIAFRNAELAELPTKAWEERFEALCAARQQEVEMAALWDTFALARHVRERIPVDDGHAREVVGECACGDQTGNTSANHNGMVKTLSRLHVHVGPPRWRIMCRLSFCRNSLLIGHAGWCPSGRRHPW